MAAGAFSCPSELKRLALARAAFLLLHEEGFMLRVPRLPRPRGSLLLVIAIAMLAFPLGVLASHQFADVPDSNPFHADIDAVADAGVTTGCGGSNFCPSANVTREQMAAFMNRLGALGPGKTPVVNAATSQAVDGFSIGCPSGTVWSGGVCLETAARSAATYFTANDTCASLSGFLGTGPRWRLPSTAELRGARGLTGIALDAGGEWTDAIHSEGGSYFSITVVDSGVINQESTIATNVYRCAAPPISLDFFLLLPLDEQARYPGHAPYEQPAQIGPDGAAQ